jgi:hypothetical protein
LVAYFEFGNSVMFKSSSSSTQLYFFDSKDEADDGLNNTETLTFRHSIRHPAPGIRRLASGIWHPASGIRHPAAGICLLAPDTRKQ